VGSHCAIEHCSCPCVSALGVDHFGSSSAAAHGRVGALHYYVRESYRWGEKSLHCMFIYFSAQALSARYREGCAIYGYLIYCIYLGIISEALGRDVTTCGGVYFGPKLFYELPVRCATVGCSSLRFSGMGRGLGDGPHCGRCHMSIVIFWWFLCLAGRAGTSSQRGSVGVSSRVHYSG